MHVVKKKIIIMIIQGFPCLPLQEAQVRSLIREVPCPGTAWPKKKKKIKHLRYTCQENEVPWNLLPEVLESVLPCFSL